MFPFSFAKALPKKNWVIRISLKEVPKIFYYSNELNLIRMGERIKYLPGQMDSISNDYDMWNVINVDGLIDFTSNSK